MIPTFCLYLVFNLQNRQHSRLRARSYRVCIRCIHAALDAQNDRLAGQVGRRGLCVCVCLERRGGGSRRILLWG